MSPMHQWPRPMSLVVTMKVTVETYRSMGQSGGE